MNKKWSTYFIDMQSTKDESDWGENRAGGGFVRLHHSIYQQKKRILLNGIENVDNIEVLPGSLSFMSRKDGYSNTMETDLDSADYNMQFLRHDNTLVSHRKWKELNFDLAHGRYENRREGYLDQSGVSSSPVSSFG